MARGTYNSTVAAQHAAPRLHNKAYGAARHAQQAGTYALRTGHAQYAQDTARRAALLCAAKHAAPGTTRRAGGGRSRKAPLINLERNGTGKDKGRTGHSEARGAAQRRRCTSRRRAHGGARAALESLQQQSTHEEASAGRPGSRGSLGPYVHSRVIGSTRVLNSNLREVEYKLSQAQSRTGRPGWRSCTASSMGSVRYQLAALLRRRAVRDARRGAGPCVALRDTRHSGLRCDNAASAALHVLHKATHACTAPYRRSYTSRDGL